MEKERLLSVWVVTSGEYSDYTINMICVTEALAQQAVQQNYGDRYEPFELVHALPALARYFCTIYVDGCRPPWVLPSPEMPSSADSALRPDTRDRLYRWVMARSLKDAETKAAAGQWEPR